MIYSGRRRESVDGFRGLARTLGQPLILVQSDTLCGSYLFRWLVPECETQCPPRWGWICINPGTFHPHNWLLAPRPPPPFPGSFATLSHPDMSDPNKGLAQTLVQTGFDL